MPPFLPPDTRTLLRRIAARNARRLGRLRSSLTPRAAWQREALRALDATLSALGGRHRAAFLLEPDLRAWLCAAENAVALSRPGATDRRLFDLLTRGPYLAEALPRGRIDRGFRRRASAIAARLTAASFDRLPVLLAFRTPRGTRFGPFPLSLAADGEDARLEGELHTWSPVPGSLRFDAAPSLELIGGGIRLQAPPARSGRAPRWRPRPTVEGSPIVLARRAVSTRRALRPAAQVPGLSRRLGRALALAGDVWPDALREIIAHTKVVIPIMERGTVSFSQADRPGVSYINVWGKSLIDLTDDLLHETAHHRLHALEELGPLVRDDGEPRYRSPWRRSIRPLRGILHAAYTFSYRAELLARLLLRRGRAPRAWLRRELAFERAAIDEALVHLEDADRRGLLTPEGSRIRSAIARRAAAT